MYNLKHKERKQARRYDTPFRSDSITDIVYSGGRTDQADRKIETLTKSFDPAPSPYRILFGEMHGHTDLSDGQPDIDTYFRVARDEAGLDFCAVTDHDHGGIHGTELWGEKWDIIRDCVARYDQPGKFTAILAYERDSYPWYNNLIIYFRDKRAAYPKGLQPGCISRDELAALLSRDDIIAVPHTTSFLSAGCDFQSVPKELMTPLIEVYSRWGADEYFGNPYPVRISCRGGFWHDALQKGTIMGCICGSDDHQGTPGLITSKATHTDLKYRFPGLTAVLARDNTVESIFEALKARRCYGIMGGRIYIDFRINNHFMGELFTAEEKDGGERDIFFDIRADAPIKRISLIKNCEDYIRFDGVPDHPCDYKYHLLDSRTESDTDYYYLRIELEDGRMAWTSPVWVSRI